MRRYLAALRVSAQLAFANRWWLALRCGGALVWTVAAYAVWHAVFAQQASVDRFEWPEIKTYLLMGALFTTVLSSDGGLAERIVDGQVAVDVTRPLGLVSGRLAEGIGRALPELAVGAAIWVVALVAIGGCALPNSASGWAVLALAMLLAALLKLCVIHTWTLACFWTQNFYGVEHMRLAITALLSGAVVPIALFPAWIGGVVGALPFAGIVVAPAEVAINDGSLPLSLEAIGLQVGWAVALLLIAGELWRRGVKRLAVQGG